MIDHRKGMEWNCGYERLNSEGKAAATWVKDGCISQAQIRSKYSQTDMTG